MKFVNSKLKKTEFVYVLNDSVIITTKSDLFANLAIFSNIWRLFIDFVKTELSAALKQKQNDLKVALADLKIRQESE